MSSLRTGKPRFQLAAPATRWQLQNAAPDFRDRQCRNKQVRPGLAFDPIRDRRRRIWFERTANDICIEKVRSHRSTSRGGTTSRSRFNSAPTAGDRRNAAQISFPLSGLSPTSLATSALNRAAIVSFSASRLASLRTSSLSCAKPRTSYRASPRSPRRRRCSVIARFCDAFISGALKATRLYSRLERRYQDRRRFQR